MRSARPTSTHKHEGVPQPSRSSFSKKAYRLATLIVTAGFSAFDKRHEGAHDC